MLIGKREIDIPIRKGEIRSRVLAKSFNQAVKPIPSQKRGIQGRSLYPPMLDFADSAGFGFWAVMLLPILALVLKT